MGNVQRYCLETEVISEEVVLAKKELQAKQKCNELAKQRCKEQGIAIFDKDNYKFLETLGRGTYGEVTMARNLKEKTMLAIKKIKLKRILEDKKLNLERKIEKYEENLTTFLNEKSTLESLSKNINYPETLSKYFGSYYEPDEKGEIEYSIIITEGGDFNLAEILSIRKKSKPKSDPYTPEEVLCFLSNIIEGYCELQKLRVYHSDTKLGNIVYSQKNKKFLIIDFGESKLIPEKKVEVLLEDYCTGGTLEYCSPEKSKFWEFRDKPENEKKDYTESFNPFKCDIWSLGKCLEEMLGSRLKEEGSYNKDLEEILGRMLEIDWRLRADAFEIKGLLESKNIKGHSQFKETEEKYVEILENERFEKEEYQKLFEKYRDATDIDKMKKIALREYEIKSRNDYKYRAEVFQRLSEAFKEKLQLTSTFHNLIRLNNELDYLLQGFDPNKKK